MATPKPADPKYFIFFTIYALLIGVAASLTVEVVKDGFDGSGKHHVYLWVVWGVALALLGISFRMYDPAVRAWIRGRNAYLRLNLASFTNVRPARGLVLLVSRGKGVMSAIYAVDYHRETLLHLWLIHSSDGGSLEGVAQIRRHCRECAQQIDIRTRQIDNVFSVEMARALVDFIRQEAYSFGIVDQDFICDFTGMNKPVSAGVVLACLRPEHRLQYMESRGFLPDGGPDPLAGARPVEVELNLDADRKG